VVLGGVAVSYERGTPVEKKVEGGLTPGGIGGGRRCACTWSCSPLPARTRAPCSRLSDLGCAVLCCASVVWCGGLGFRVSGFGIRNSGFRFHDPGFGIRVSGFMLRVSGFGFRPRCRFRISGLGIGDSGFGVRVSTAVPVSDFGIRDWGFWIRGSGVDRGAGWPPADVLGRADCPPRHSSSSSLISSFLHSHVNLEWCDKIKLSNLLLPPPLSYGSTLWDVTNKTVLSRGT